MATVVMSEYNIQQKTGGPPIETAVSKVIVSFEMIASNDTSSIKHEDFLNDLRVFLDRRNASLS